MNELTIYVPSMHSAKSAVGNLRRGSAIVGIPGVGEYYFEGNLFDAVNMRTFEGRLQIAAGRYDQDYPTSAHLTAVPEALTPVGTARKLRDTAQWVVASIDEPELLQLWLGNEPLPEVGGSEEIRNRYASKAFMSMSASEQAHAQMTASARGVSVIDVVWDGLHL